jgi:hypothetical protein
VASGTTSPQFGACRYKRKVVHSKGTKSEPSKLKERTGNVYENKGTLQKTEGRSGNVYEN